MDGAEETQPEPLTQKQRFSWFRWSYARTIANSRLPQVSAIIPVIGYAVLWSDHFSGLLASHVQLGESWLPLQLRLQLLWWGAIFMTLGLILYVLCCPKVIKRNGSPEDYVLEQFQAPNCYQIEKSRQQVEELVKGYHPGDTRGLIYGGYSPREIHLASSRLHSQNHDAFEPRHAYMTALIFTLDYYVIDHKRWFVCVIVLSLLIVG